MMRSRTVGPAGVAAAATLLVAGATTVGAAHAAAQPEKGADSSMAAVRQPVVVARGLDNPRLLSVHKGAVYVVEAGRGGHGPCVTSAEGGSVCFGHTGSVTRIRHGHQKRVLTGLPSVAGGDGASASGPQAIRFDHQRYVLTIGAGLDTATRARLGTAGRRLGTIVRGTLGGRQARVVADIARFERRRNADHSRTHDSNPTGFAVGRHAYLVTDSGGNDLLWIGRGGRRVHVVAVFPSRTVDLPPQVGGGKAPMQAVPTSVTAGPGGALYVSQLTGFPFPEGASRIWKVRPGHRPQVFATGLTNVTDLTWHAGRLYAVQLADHGLLAATGLPMGSLVRVHHGDNRAPTVVAGGLPAPYGVAIAGRYAWLSVCSVCAGGGQVVRVPLG